MDNIKDIINNVVGKLASQQEISPDKIHRAWKAILTEKKQKHTSITGYKDGWLTVQVDTPTWLYQMKVEKLKILKQLQEEVPDLKNIRFKIGKV